MILEKALDRANLSIEQDKLPKKDRTVKAVSRLIAAFRAVEAEWLAQEMERERKMNDLQAKANEQLQANLALQERLHLLENELKRYKLKEQLGQIESIPEVQKRKLLGLDEAA